MSASTSALLELAAAVLSGMPATGRSARTAAATANLCPAAGAGPTAVRHHDRAAPTELRSTAATAAGVLVLLGHSGVQGVAAGLSKLKPLWLRDEGRSDERSQVPTTRLLVLH